MQLGDRFDSIDAARNAIKAFVLDQGESYKTILSDKKRFIIGCKDGACKFRIRATRSTKRPVSITILDLYTCTPAVYYKARQPQSIGYLAEHHRAAMIDNRDITPAQLRSSERLEYGNTISYLQAHRTIKAVIRQVEGSEAESFSKFVHYGQRIKDSDPNNYYHLETDDEGHFQAFFCAPAGLRHAFKFLRHFIGLDGTHTSSKFRMQLLIAGGIDANNHILPLAYALVPIECTKWWQWFLKHLAKANPRAVEGEYVFISD